MATGRGREKGFSSPVGLGLHRFDGSSWFHAHTVTGSPETASGIAGNRHCSAGRRRPSSPTGSPAPGRRKSRPPATHGGPASPDSLFSGSVWVHHDRPSLSLSLNCGLSLGLSSLLLSLSLSRSCSLSRSLISASLSLSATLSVSLSFSLCLVGYRNEEGRREKRRRIKRKSNEEGRS
jgi:hypothetical protein